MKKRGRPRKVQLEPQACPHAPKKRGRPCKVKPEALESVPTREHRNEGQPDRMALLMGVHAEWQRKRSQEVQP
jgi:hypothetical protein